MSSFFVLNNVPAPALPLWGDGGKATKFVFWEDLTSTGGPPVPKQGFTEANCCECPDDNGDSWTVDDVRGAARGAFIFIEVVGKVDFGEVNSRLQACKANQKRVFELAQGGPSHGEGTYDPSTPFAKPGQTLNVPTWQRLNYKSEAKWIKDGSPTE
jgi:hypothetical protein